MVIENLCKIIEIANLRSPRVIASIFVVLILCGFLVFVSQLESTEEHQKSFSKHAFAYNRKLQTLKTNNKQQKKISLASTEAEDTNNGIEKRDVDSKSRLYYQKVVIQLLSDNELLRMKLNRTLQALKQFVQQDCSNCEKKACDCTKPCVAEEKNQLKQDGRSIAVTNNKTFLNSHKDEKSISQTAEKTLTANYDSDKMLRRSKNTDSNFSSLSITKIVVTQSRKQTAVDKTTTHFLSSVTHKPATFSNKRSSRPILSSSINTLHITSYPASNQRNAKNKLNNEFTNTGD